MIDINPGMPSNPAGPENSVYTRAVMMAARPILTLFAASMFIAVAHAAEFPPQDHAGADLILADGDEIWGAHTNIGRFVVPEDAVARVRWYHPDEPGTGMLDIYASEVEIAGTLTAEGAGYTGGGGGAGARGVNQNCQEGEHGEPGKGRYPGGFDGSIVSPGVGDGPFAGVRGADQEIDGGYDAPGGNDDATTDTLIMIGSGGAGAWATPSGAWLPFPGFPPCEGYPGGSGGGGGGSGGGAIRIFASGSLMISGSIQTRGTTGGNGAPGHEGQSPDCEGCINGDGGAGGDGFGNEGGSHGNPLVQSRTYQSGPGAGGGLVLHCMQPDGLSMTGLLDARGGNAVLVNGGTIKVFYRGDVHFTGERHTPRLYFQNLDNPGGPGPVSVWLIR